MPAILSAALRNSAATKPLPILSVSLHCSTATTTTTTAAAATVEPRPRGGHAHRPTAAPRPMHPLCFLGVTQEYPLSDRIFKRSSASCESWPPTPTSPTSATSTLTPPTIPQPVHPKSRSKNIMGSEKKKKKRSRKEILLESKI